MPLYEEDRAAYSYHNIREIETDFYASLALLSGQNELRLQQSQQLGYPYNIAMALADLKEQLMPKIKDWEEVALIHHDGSTFFAREMRFYTGSTLYYIPVIPLFRMLKDPAKKTAACLLLSVCCYLYRIADIPYYRQEGTYLYYMYDMLFDWMQEEDQPSDSELMTDYRHAVFIGDIMEAKLQNPANLKWFEHRLSAFKPVDNFGEECLRLAKEAFKLYEQYPTTAIDRNFRESGGTDYEDGDYGISLDKYISFYAAGKGTLSNCLQDNINVDLQGYGYVDEPVIYKPIDGREIEGNDFDFEKELFALLGDVATILYTYEHNEHEEHH